MADEFEIVGIVPRQTKAAAPKKSRLYGFPVASAIVLGIIVCGCLGCDWIMTKNPAYMDLAHSNQAPNAQFWFGTDAMGRDIFSMIWYGGRISLFIGVCATLVSTVAGIMLGTAAGCAPEWLDALLMRLTEIFLSIPNLLLVIFLQAALGTANVLSLSFVIGMTSWAGIAKVVRSEVKSLKNAGFVAASRAMGGGFFYVLRRHLAPNFAPSIVFMVVMNVRSAMVAESTLSFMGIGLPTEQISWGSMLSLANRALTTRSWWMILIPGAFLVTTLVCMTNLGNWLRAQE